MSTPPPIQPPPAPNATIDAPRNPVPNYMAWSIVSTILGLCVCCVIGAIPGIVAIVFSSKVNSALDRGDYAEAKRASDNARLWCWITTGLVIAGVILNIIFVATGGMAQYMDLVSQMEAAQGR
jgi:hypothetical protein